MMLSGDRVYRHALAIVVPRGSAVIWHGNASHGSWPQEKLGLRLNLATYFCRQYMAPQEIYHNNLPNSFLERHGRDSRMAQLVGLNRINGWQEEGPDMGVMRAMPAGKNWYA